MKKLITLVIFLCGASGAIAQEPQASSAPFGLQWSATKEEVERSQVALQAEKGDSYGATFRASNLPKVLTDTETVFLSFGYDNRLWRIVAASKTWRSDMDGSQSSDRYHKISNLLDERYGKGQDISSAPRNKFMLEVDKFAYSIYSNERTQAKNWSTPTLNIQLGLRAASMNDLYYIIIYENKQLSNTFTKAKASKEKDAL